ncbi:MAG: FliO/MopB family protein [Bryobacteraceae bacterium]
MKVAACLTLCGAVMLLLADGAFALQSAPPSSSSPAATQSVQKPGKVLIPTTPLPASSGSGIQLAIYLCLLVALLGGGSYFLKNGFNLLPQKNKGMRKLNVAETRMLGNRQFLVVAEYEGRKMLLGVCPGRIELISDLGGKADESFAAHLGES